jgi:hypothetical protein
VNLADLGEQELTAAYLAAADAMDWPLVDACEAEIDRRHPPAPLIPARLRQPGSLAAAARFYAAAGLPIFPLRPGTKIPFPRTHGLKDATADADQVRSWWARTPQANIGMPTGGASGFDVVDVDGPEGWAVLDDIALPPILARARTCQPGRWHLFIAARGAGNRAKIAGTPLDYRGDGGYVVLAPSRVDGLGQYRWIDPPEALR